MEEERHDLEKKKLFGENSYGWFENHCAKN
jgi:hypothetical protein